MQNSGSPDDLARHTRSGSNAEVPSARYLEIARALLREIRAGVHRPGAPLQSSRELAAALAVHRNTVIAAYRELLSEGWVKARPKVGMFVADVLPERVPRRFLTASPPVKLPTEPNFDLRGVRPRRRGLADRTLGPLHRATRSDGVIALSEGSPDVRLLPTALLARSYRRALRDPSNLEYRDARGHEKLRAALAHMLRQERRMPITERNIVVTAGSQMAIDLCAQLLVRPGDTVAVEAIGYAPAWSALTSHGAKLVSIPIDHEGMVVDELARRCERGPVSAVYVTPHHQYPTTVTLSPRRRIQLLALARIHRFAILEDDYDHEYHYSGRPILPLASEDHHGNVIYIGTLSKVTAPGLRMGYVVGPERLVDEVAQARFVRDRHGDAAIEAAVAELLEDGEIARHVWRSRRVYRARRDAMAEMLHELFGASLTFRVPHGGLTLWAQVHVRGLVGWVRRAAEAGVLLRTGADFTFDGKAAPYIRFGFAAPTEAESRDALSRMRAAMRP